MRHTLSPQLQLGEHDVSTIKFDALSRDDIPQLIRGLQHLYDDKEDRDAVLDLLKENMLETVDADTGRPGMRGNRVFPSPCRAADQPDSSPCDPR